MDEQTKMSVENVLLRMANEVNSLAETIEQKTKEINFKIVQLRAMFGLDLCPDSEWRLRMQVGNGRLQPSFRTRFGLEDVFRHFPPQNEGDAIRNGTASRTRFGNLPQNEGDANRNATASRTRFGNLPQNEGDANRNATASRTRFGNLPQNEGDANRNATASRTRFGNLPQNEGDANRNATASRTRFGNLPQNEDDANRNATASRTRFGNLPQNEGGANRNATAPPRDPTRRNPGDDYTEGLIARPQPTASRTRFGNLPENEGNVNRSATAPPRAPRRRNPGSDSDEPEASFSGGIRRPQPTASRARSSNPQLNEGDANRNATALARAPRRRSSGSDSDEPEARRRKKDTDESARQESPERSSQRDFLPPSVNRAVDETRGILNSVDFRSFLFMTREDIEDPVLMTEMTFTTHIDLVYYQLLALRYNIRRQYTRGEDTPSEVRDFLDKLELLITAFNQEVQQVNAN